MNTDTPKLRNASIVEAVLDIDCDMPPDVELADLEEPARERFGDQYPKARNRVSHELTLKAKAEALSSLPPAEFAQQAERGHAPFLLLASIVRKGQNGEIGLYL